EREGSGPTGRAPPVAGQPAPARLCEPREQPTIRGGHGRAKGVPLRPEAVTGRGTLLFLRVVANIVCSRLIHSLFTVLFPRASVCYCEINGVPSVQLLRPEVIPCHNAKASR